MTILRCKVVIVGDPRVGKSALTQCFHSNLYPKNYIMTLGVDFCVKAVPIPGSGNTVELFVFDMSGEDMYQDLHHHCWNVANVILAAFDVTSRQSFDNAKVWVNRVREYTKNPKLKGLLVGCKSDLKEFSDISIKEATEQANSIGLEYMECSAAAGKNIDSPFLFVANSFHENYEHMLDELSNEL